LIKINIKVGDTILTGKWKNKKIVVKSIDTDEFGSPTVNGKSILKIRIPKLYQKENISMKLKDLIKEDFKITSYKLIEPLYVELRNEKDSAITIPKNAKIEVTNYNEAANRISIYYKGKDVVAKFSDKNKLREIK